MKLKKIYLGMIVAVGLLTACDGWLDVKPVDKVTEDELYDSEKGFQRELNGFYLTLASNSLYGEYLSCGALEVMGQHYFINTSDNKYYNLSQYEYTQSNVKSCFESIWMTTYNLIADCNIFMENLRKRKSVVKGSDYNLYLGEAYGLRAFLHLEMLRIFGPVCTEENREKTAIPYYDFYTATPQPLLTVGEVIEKIERDLDQALALLKTDPILTEGVVEEDGFWNYRNARMNYYAVYILKGRLYLHAGQKEKAYQIASALLSGRDPVTDEPNNFKQVITPVSVSDLKEDRVYLSEQVFYVQNLKRDERVYKALFSPDLESQYIMAASPAFISNLFTVSEQNDYRYQQWTDASSHEGMKLFLKYAPVSLVTGDTDPDRFKIHPLIRLGELYLMAAESAEEDDSCLEWMEKFRLNRGYLVGNTVGVSSDQLLDQEYAREFYGEGQYFFYLKRNQVETLQAQSGTKINMPLYYQVPLPESETNGRYE